jgi:serine/alanine adding enzyme
MDNKNTKIYNAGPNSDWTEIDRFVRNHQNGNFFHTSYFQRVYQAEKNHQPFAIILKKNNQIAGVLAGVRQYIGAKYIGKTISRSIIWGGPLVLDNDPGIAWKIMAAYLKRFGSKSFYTEIRNLHDISAFDKLLKQLAFNFTPHLDIHHNLTSDPDESWQRVHKNRRKEIRKAERKGVVTREISKQEKSLLEAGIQMLQQLYKRLKLPLPDKIFFNECSELLMPEGVVRVFGAFFDNKLIGIRWVLCFEKQIYDWYAAADEANLHLRPNDVLPWTVIKWGCENGYNRFDFGGAGKPGKAYGVRDFKIRFGGNLVSLGRYYHSPFPLAYHFALGLKGIFGK